VVSSTPGPHFTPGKDPVPILQEAGWAPGSVWTGGKSRPYRNSIPDRPARSQSLHRLSYPAHPPYVKSEIYMGSRDSSAGKGTSCGLNGPVGPRFSALFQTSCEAHPVSYTVGTGSFLGVKRTGRGVDHPPHPAPRLKKE